MSTVGDLKNILSELKSSGNIDLCAVISRNGIPLAYELPNGAHVDVFSTLSATMLGASEVIYSGLGKQIPHRIVVESKEGTYMATGAGPKALLAAMSSQNDTSWMSNVATAADKIKEVLSHA